MIVPSADLVALAVVHASVQSGLPPERAFDPGDVFSRVRVLAAVSLVKGELASPGPAARALGFAYQSALSPSRLSQLKFTAASWRPIVEALYAAGHHPLGRHALFATGASWSPEELAIVRAGLVAKQGDAETAKALPNRSVCAVKKQRLVMLNTMSADERAEYAVRRGRKLTPDDCRRGGEVAKARALKEWERLKAVVAAPGDHPIDLRHTAADGWTERRLAVLKQHIVLNLSAGRSADLLGVTKNTIIGKRHRLEENGASPEARKIGGAITRVRRRAATMASLGRAKPAPVERAAPAQARPLPAPPAAPEPVKAAFHPPRVGPLTAHAFPICVPRALTSDTPLADRIVARLNSDGPLSSSALAFLCDAKELVVTQAVRMLERDGRVRPGPMPAEGRRAQRWMLPTVSEVAA